MSLYFEHISVDRHFCTLVQSDVLSWIMDRIECKQEVFSTDEHVGRYSCHEVPASLRLRSVAAAYVDLLQGGNVHERGLH
jgi:hypothetical protein